MTDTTHDASLTDDGFHEIQLSGKQLVFLFMMATVVLVATFLLGVQVGRSVRGDHGLDATTAEALSTTATPPAPSTPSRPVASAGPQSAEPPSPAQEPDDELSYAKRLQGDAPPAEKLKTPSASEGATPKHESAPPKSVSTTSIPATAPPKPAPPKPTSATPTRAIEAPKPTSVPTPPIAASGSANAESKPTDAQTTESPSAPAATGQPGAWVVQLQALKNRSEAAGIVGRLSAKGFPAFVLDPVPGEPVYYRVQVGGYADRAQADQVARQLEKDEHYKPYVRRR